MESDEMSNASQDNLDADIAELEVGGPAAAPAALTPAEARTQAASAALKKALSPGFGFLTVNIADLDAALTEARAAGVSPVELSEAEAKLAESRAEEKATYEGALQKAMKPGFFGGRDVPALTAALDGAIAAGVKRELLEEAVAMLPEDSQQEYAARIATQPGTPAKRKVGLRKADGTPGSTGRSGPGLRKGSKAIALPSGPPPELASPMDGTPRKPRKQISLPDSTPPTDAPSSTSKPKMSRKKSAIPEGLPPGLPPSRSKKGTYENGNGAAASAPPQ